MKYPHLLSPQRKKKKVQGEMFPQHITSVKWSHWSKHLEKSCSIQKNVTMKQNIGPGSRYCLKALDKNLKAY